MKTWFCAALFLVLFGLSACSNDSNPSVSDSSGRIDPGLLGTWVENPSAFSRPDTLIFAENKIRTPFFSAVGTQFTAKDGVVKGGPSMTAYGEYARFGDTLYFDALLGQAPDGVDKNTAERFLKTSL
jgi:hypothetical protein